MSWKAAGAQGTPRQLEISFHLPGKRFPTKIRPFLTSREFKLTNNLTCAGSSHSSATLCAATHLALNQTIQSLEEKMGCRHPINWLTSYRDVKIAFMGDLPATPAKNILNQDFTKASLINRSLFKDPEILPTGALTGPETPLVIVNLTSTPIDPHVYKTVIGRDLKTFCPGTIVLAVAPNEGIGQDLLTSKTLGGSPLINDYLTKEALCQNYTLDPREMFADYKQITSGGSLEDANTELLIVDLVTLGKNRSAFETAGPRLEELTTNIKILYPNLAVFGIVGDRDQGRKFLKTGIIDGFADLESLRNEKTPEKIKEEFLRLLDNCIDGTIRGVWDSTGIFYTLPYLEETLFEEVVGGLKRGNRSLSLVIFEYRFKPEVSKIVRSEYLNHEFRDIIKGITLQRKVRISDPKASGTGINSNTIYLLLLECNRAGALQQAERIREGLAEKTQGNMYITNMGGCTLKLDMGMDDRKIRQILFETARRAQGSKEIIKPETISLISSPAANLFGLEQAITSGSKIEIEDFISAIERLDEKQLLNLIRVLLDGINNLKDRDKIRIRAMAEMEEVVDERIQACIDIKHDLGNLLTAVLGNSDFVSEGLGDLNRLLNNLRETIKKHREQIKTAIGEEELSYLEFYLENMLEKIKIVQGDATNIGKDSGRIFATQRNLSDALRNSSLKEQITEISFSDKIIVALLDECWGRSIEEKPDPDFPEKRKFTYRTTENKSPKNLTISIEAENDLPFLLINFEKFRSIFMNILVGNAIAYSDEGEIYLKIKRDGNNIEFSVRDQGIGIEKEYQHKIFQPGFRIDESRNTQGSGDGLFAAAEWIKKMCGKIWVESEIGKGSTFYFSLPIPNQEENQP